MVVVVVVALCSRACVLSKETKRRRHGQGFGYLRCLHKSKDRKPANTFGCHHDLRQITITEPLASFFNQEAMDAPQ
jgi:hypothetical protein